MGTQYQITGSVLAQQLSSTISNPSHPALPKYTHPHWKTKEEYEAVKEKKSHKTQEEEVEDWVGIRMCEGKIYRYMWSFMGNQSEKEILHGLHHSEGRETCARHKVKMF